MTERTTWRERRFRKIITSLDGKILNADDLTGGRSPSGLFCLWGGQIGKLLDDNWRPTRAGIRFRRLIHPIFPLLGEKFLSNPQVIENRNRLMDAASTAPDNGITLPDEPVIFCVNHHFKDDILGAVRAVPRHAYILFGSLPAFFNTFDGVSAWLNGVVLCNRKVAASRKTSTENAIRVLQMGGNLLIFPEGVWNKTPERLLLDFWPGIYRIAKATGAKVVPVVHYIRNTEDSSPENVIHAVVDEPLRLDDLPEKEALSLLRDRMATWYYLMMERYGKSTRQELLGDFGSSEEAWEDYIAEHTRPIYYYDKEIEFSADCRPRDIPLPQDVYRQVADIQKITPDNASAVAAAVRIVEQARKRDVQRRY